MVMDGTGHYYEVGWKRVVNAAAGNLQKGLDTAIASDPTIRS